MRQTLSPKEFGLPARTVIEQLDDGLIAIVIDRKSRIIMADGRKIVEKMKKIMTARPEATYGLKTSGPVCSKTAAFLKTNNIQLISFVPPERG